MSQPFVVRPAREGGWGCPSPRPLRGRTSYILLEPGVYIRTSSPLLVYRVTGLLCRCTSLNLCGHMCMLALFFEALSRTASTTGGT